MTRPIRLTTPIPIPQVQGRGALSPYDGKSVTTSGMITAIKDTKTGSGFFLQDPKGDGDTATSDALFVGTDNLPPQARTKFEVGRKVEVNGRVSEAKQFTTIVVDETGVRPIKGTRKTSPSGLPAAVKLDMPETIPGRKTYLEAREGMLATLANALVIGATTKYDNFTVVDERQAGPGRHYGDDQASLRLQVSGRLGPGTQMVTGDRVTGIHGPIGFQFDDYEILQTRNYAEIKRGPYPPRLWGDLDNDDRITGFDVRAIRRQVGEQAIGPLDPADVDGNGQITATDANLAAKRATQQTGAPAFTIATMNAENYFDTVDAPPPIDDDVPSQNQFNNKIARIAGAIRDHLHFPEVLAMQEVENSGVLKALVERPELRAMGYKYALMQTNGHRSINPAVIYRGDTVAVSDVRQAQKMLDARESKKLGLIDPDIGGKKPLFAREPLIVDMTVGSGQQKRDVTVIANHLISKFSPLGLPTEPIRIAQAQFLNELTKELRGAHPDREVVILGDLNDTPDSRSLKALTGPAKSPVLVNVSATQVPKGERFSYNYKGTSELIDHILVTPGLVETVERAGIRHYNSDIPESERWGSGNYAPTDHDTPYVTFRLGQAGAIQAVDGAASVQPKTRATKRK